MEVAKAILAGTDFQPVALLISVKYIYTHYSALLIQQRRLRN